MTTRNPEEADFTDVPKPAQTTTAEGASVVTDTKIDRRTCPIQVGDRVRCTGGTTTGVVLAVKYADGKTTGTPGIHDYATICMDRTAGWQETFPIRTLTRLPSGSFSEVLARCVERLDEHLDRDVADTYQGQPLAQDWARVAKVVEEAGEAIAELIGMTGQNPRKGVTSNQERLLAELADVALTGLYAIQHFTKDADQTLALLLSKTIYHCERVGVDVIE